MTGRNKDGYSISELSRILPAPFPRDKLSIKSFIEKNQKEFKTFFFEGEKPNGNRLFVNKESFNKFIKEKYEINL